MRLLSSPRQWFIRARRRFSITGLLLCTHNTARHTPSRAYCSAHTILHVTLHHGLTALHTQYFTSHSITGLLVCTHNTARHTPPRAYCSAHIHCTSHSTTGLLLCTHNTARHIPSRVYCSAHTTLHVTIYQGLTSLHTQHSTSHSITCLLLCTYNTARHNISRAYCSTHNTACNTRSRPSCISHTALQIRKQCSFHIYSHMRSIK